MKFRRLHNSPPKKPTFFQNYSFLYISWYLYTTSLCYTLHPLSPTKEIHSFVNLIRESKKNSQSRSSMPDGGKIENLLSMVSQSGSRSVLRRIVWNRRCSCNCAQSEASSPSGSGLNADSPPRNSNPTTSLSLIPRICRSCSPYRSRGRVDFSWTKAPGCK